MGCYHTGGLDEYLDWMMEQSLIKDYRMSSGRDEWMSNWSQETKREVYKPKSPLERMYALRDTLKADLERIEHNIKEYEDAEKKTI